MTVETHPEVENGESESQKDELVQSGKQFFTRYLHFEIKTIMKLEKVKIQFIFHAKTTF